MSQESERALEMLDRLVFRNTTPIVVALVGGWGEGKTHFWHNSVEPRFQQQNPSYVSVFGANSLGEIRERVVVERLAKGGESVDVRAGVLRKLKRKAWEKVAPLFGRTAGAAESYLGLPQSFMAQLLQGSALTDGGVVCFDDIERLSDGVNIEELLGYVAELRDKWKLRVVLIFNRRSFDVAEKNKFQKYEEKVIDRSIPFRLDLQYILNLTFGDLTIEGVDVLTVLTEKSNALDLRNIRLLHKTRAHFDEIRGALPDDASPAFVLEVLLTTLLLIFIKYSDKCPPELSFKLLLDYNEWVELMERNKRSSPLEDEEQPNPAKALLERFGYKFASDVDKVLIEFVETGLLDVGRLNSEYASFDANQARHDRSERIRVVFSDLYHGTFHAASSLGRH